MKATLSFNTKEYQEYSAVLRVLDDIQEDLVSVTRKVTGTGIETNFSVEITINATEAEYMQAVQMYMHEFEGLNLSHTRPNTD